MVSSGTWTYSRDGVSHSHDCTRCGYVNVFAGEPCAHGWTCDGCDSDDMRRDCERCCAPSDDLSWAIVGDFNSPEWCAECRKSGE